VLATVLPGDGVVAWALGVALSCGVTGEAAAAGSALPALTRVTPPVRAIVLAESTPRVAGSVLEYPQVFEYQYFSVPE